MDMVQSTRSARAPRLSLRDVELDYVEERFRIIFWQFERGRAVEQGYVLNSANMSRSIAEMTEELAQLPLATLLFLGELACGITEPQPHDDEHYRARVLSLLNDVRCPDVRLTRALRDIVPDISFVTRWCFLV